MEIKYKTEIVRNERVITAILPDERFNKVQSLIKPEVTLPFVSNDKLSVVKFSFSTGDNQKVYVVFAVHRFVKNITTVEKLIEAADKYLGELSNA